MVAFAALGIGLILYYESRGVALDAVLWGLASSFFYAGVVLSLRQLRGFDSVWLAALNHTVTVIALAPFAIGAHEWPSGIQWVFFAAFGILQMGLPYVLFGAGFKRIPGHEATAIGLIEPLLNPMWVLAAWGDRAGLVDDRRRPIHFDWAGDSLPVALTEVDDAARIKAHRRLPRRLMSCTTSQSSSQLLPPRQDTAHPPGSCASASSSTSRTSSDVRLDAAIVLGIDVQRLAHAAARESRLARRSPGPP